MNSKENISEYESLFIKKSNNTARLGKSVYVRREFHEKIQKIVQTVGNNEVSISDYIDNIIVHHFETFQEDIMKSYRKKVSNNIF